MDPDLNGARTPDGGVPVISLRSDQPEGRRDAREEATRDGVGRRRDRCPEDRPQLGPGAREHLTLVLVGNLVGALFVASFLAVQSGVIGDAASASGSSAALTFERLTEIAQGKATGHTAWETFLRAVGCNWLVCLAVWMTLAATTVSGKILALFFPIMAFVAMGFDHVVANMFFLPAAIFAGVPDVGWDDTVVNWLIAGAGNLVGAVVFVATSYWYLFLKDEPADDGSGAEAPERA
ncbi:formate/nitrite transporter family protein [Geodermatophilus sp. YIM 151500]|uniref:formate/nitrite transporter family protein n=1 Tax=Geodermatophilus sp. YIM 151500 TaxID=2984531 RepID=UPI0021E4EF7B|nr:formate/nitrite transporter family protein [Geodermatophilus sp. YIM 151500]MCV2491596.1 formate/nitrite transporter family protein [Geodermatophilus sp. YIM 151500]